jgi:hypothetical protein
MERTRASSQLAFCFWQGLSWFSFRGLPDQLIPAHGIMEEVLEACRNSVESVLDGARSTHVCREELLKLARNVARVSLLLTHLELHVAADEGIKGERSSPPNQIYRNSSTMLGILVHRRLHLTMQVMRGCSLAATPWLLHCSRLRH